MVELLNAFKQGQEEPMVDLVARYRGDYSPPLSPEARSRNTSFWRGVLNDYASYEIYSYSEAGPHKMQALVYSTTSKGWRVVTVELDDSVPRRVKDFYMRDAPGPRQ